MKRIYFYLFILILFCGCGNSQKKIFSELEKFDSSLDSLINEPMFDYSKYCIFQGDTLKNSPKQIEITCYKKIGNDSILIDANCHIYKFENNELIFNHQEDILGNKYVCWYIYFKDKIDNELISNLQKKYANTDTFVNGYVKKYNKDGKLLKSIRTADWIEANLYRRVKTKEIRHVEVYNYNQKDDKCTMWRRNYFSGKYNIDTIKATPIEQINIDCNKRYDKDSDYAYTYDEYGNWIVKKCIMSFEYDEATDSYVRRKPENYDAYYRKITY